MKKLCIIPARGGSKRIPLKNIKNFCGKPIITYSIQAALDSQLFDEVMVSTDDGDIANIAQTSGASVPYMRSKKNSDDFATTFDVIEEVLAFYKSKNQFFDSVCCIYPCAPFVTAEGLHSSLKVLTDGDFDSVFPVIQFSFPIQRALKLSGEKASYFYPEHSLSRSQDLKPSYHDAGQYYWIRVNVLERKKSIVTDNSGVVIISELQGQDIDNETDWKIAELKYQLTAGNARS